MAQTPWDVMKPPARVEWLRDYVHELYELSRKTATQLEELKKTLTSLQKAMEELKKAHKGG